MSFELRRGDCREVMASLPENSVDAIVTDPPYGLHFMGKTWDSFGGAIGKDHTATTERSGSMHAGKYDLSRNAEFQAWCETWSREAYRVLKPGGHLLAFGGSRTYHRLACAIEDAGFEIRDQLQWIYGQGFPKSHNLGNGFGTALKPAHEPIVLARKPLVGTVAANVAAHGTGALNIDGCRIEGVMDGTWGARQVSSIGYHGTESTDYRTEKNALGRWPANVCLDEDAAALLDAQSGERGAASRVRGSEPSAVTDGIYGARGRVLGAFHGDSGGASRFFLNVNREGEASADKRYTDEGSTNFAPLPGQRREPAESVSRFFYCAKASRSERNAGLDGLPEREGGAYANGAGMPGRTLVDGEWVQTGTWQEPNRTPRANHHPTVKPVALMRWLCRLITPPDGLILDPFTGSGTTGIAALQEGFAFLGIEQDAEYIEIARRRIEHAAAELEERAANGIEQLTLAG